MGFWITALSFVFWGLMPPYWKYYNGCDPLELIAHRIFWGFVSVALIFIIRGELFAFLKNLNDKKCVRLHILSAALILVNWLTFVWAVINGRILDTSLGYYLVPMLNVAIGRFLLHEELRRMRKWAITFAFSGVVILFVIAGKVPIPALILAGTFSIYGLISKHTTLGAMQRMGMECLLLMPLAVGYLLWIALVHNKGLLLGEYGSFLRWFTPTTGIITITPLILFTWGAKRVEFSTVGLLQFIGPSLSFVFAVIVYKEPFTPSMGAAFVCIWIALTLYSIDLLKNRNKFAKQKGATK